MQLIKDLTMSVEDIHAMAMKLKCSRTILGIKNVKSLSRRVEASVEIGSTRALNFMVIFSLWRSIFRFQASVFCLRETG